MCIISFFHNVKTRLEKRFFFLVAYPTLRAYFIIGTLFSYRKTVFFFFLVWAVIHPYHRTETKVGFYRRWSTSRTVHQMAFTPYFFIFWMAAGCGGGGNGGGGGAARDRRLPLRTGRRARHKLNSRFAPSVRFTRAFPIGFTDPSSTVRPHRLSFRFVFRSGALWLLRPVSVFSSFFFGAPSFHSARVGLAELFSSIRE